MSDTGDRDCLTIGQRNQELNIVKYPVSQKKVIESSYAMLEYPHIHRNLARSAVMLGIPLSL